ncbi:MAG: hypothetical protein ACK524_05550 [Planctomyces sp.]
MPTADIGRTISVSRAEGNLLLSVASRTMLRLRSAQADPDRRICRHSGAGCPHTATQVAQVSQPHSLIRHRP